MSWWQRWRDLFDRGRREKPSSGPGGRGGCDHGDISLRQGSAEFEWFVARGELEVTGNLAHGASHLANLLTFDPGNPDFIELLERYLAAAGPDPETLIPRGEQLYASTEAMRAYIWQRQGRLPEAIRLLVDVVHARPSDRYLEAWGLDWLEAPGAVESLDAALAHLVFASVLGRFPEARKAPVRVLHQAGRWARLADRCAAAHRDPDPAGLMMRAGLLRKAGRYGDAESVVRSAIARQPGWHAASALGLILRQKGDSDGAEEAFRMALGFQPDDRSARLEAGDTFFEIGEWTRALRWYEEVLALDADHPWALPSATYCRWKLADDRGELDTLIGLARRRNERAYALYCRDFFAPPGEPSDATANMIRQLRRAIIEDPETAPAGEIRLTLSSMEAPSNVLAFRLEMAALGRDARLLMAVQRVPVPDPRVPIGDVNYTLWHFDGIEPMPGLPPPPDDVVRRIADLAMAPYDEALHWAGASRIAEEIGAARVGEVLAVMVHPPPVPAGTEALAWLPRIHRAAIEVAAQVDEGWEGAARREALMSVLLGPRDWPTEEAIRVLARLGREHESIATDIHDAFQKLADHRPDQGYCPWEQPLYRRWLELPHLFPAERDELQRTLDAIIKSQESDD